MAILRSSRPWPRLMLALAPFVVFDLALSTRALASPRADIVQKTYVVKKSRLLTEPTAFGEGIAVIAEGLEVEVLEYNLGGKWVKIRTPSGREGWIQAKATALTGRREKPLISQNNGQGNGQPNAAAYAKNGNSASRDPASVDEESATTAGLPTEKPGEGGAANTLSVGLAYLNQVNRSQTSGFGGQVAFEFGLGPINIGPAAAIEYFHESATNTSVNASVTRNDLKIQPGIALSYRPKTSGFTLSSMLALDIDHTAIRTVNTQTGAEIPTSGGAKTTGTENSYGLAAAFEPGFQFAFSGGSALSVLLNYHLTYAFGSPGGDFLGGAGSSLVHAVGLGINYVNRF